MSQPSWAKRGVGYRALQMCGRAVRVLFFLALVGLPVPIANLFGPVLRQRRRNDPAQVLKKR